MKVIVKALLSIALGLLLAPCLTWVWAQIASHGLFADPALNAGLRGNTLHAVLALTDFAANFVLMLPAAWVLCRLGRERLVPHVALAVVALGVASGLLPSFGHGFWPAASTILFYAALPVATWVVSRFSGRAPNNSFKPKPLRGSA